MSLRAGAHQTGAHNQQPEPTKGDELLTPPTTNRGQFRRGPGPRRHRFTTAECQAGLWKAIESIILRYPDAVDSAGPHMASDYLKVAGKQTISRINAKGLESA
jgi:hypothetical protein